MAAENTLANDILRRMGTLKGLRSIHEQVWRDCYDHSFPIRSQGFNGDSESISGTQAKRARLYDSTATDGGRILASGIQSGMTPANSRWFGMKTWNESDEERRWFDGSADSLWQEIHASNFDADSFECNIDIVAAGWFVLFIDEHKSDEGDADGLQFTQWPIASCYCASSRPGGNIDTVYRSYTLTVEQAVSEFGIDKVSEKTREMYLDGEYDKPVALVHAIYPRRVSMVGAKRAKNLPYASVHVECEGKRVVRESGYHERPFVAPRWSLIPNSCYAIGPMFDALPDVKTLNDIARMELMNADMAIAGTYVAVDDGVLNPRTVRVGPRIIIVANDTESIKPLQSGGDFSISFAKREQLVAAIRRTLMADQLQPQDGPAMTATEVHVRVQLIRQLLGPVYGRLQAEYLQPLIERCFGLAFRAGLFEPPPQTLQDRTFSVVYLSPLAKAQKLEEVNAIEGSFAAIGALAQTTGDPGVWDNVDVDEGIRMGADGRGVPAKIVRSADDVARIRQQRADQQQAAQAQAAEQQLGMEAASAGIEKMVATA